MFGLPEGDIAYDIETYPNLFTFIARHPKTRQSWVFELSDRKNEIPQLRMFLKKCELMGCRWVGYNNLGFDYPVVHFILTHANATAQAAYNKAMTIIEGRDRFGHIIWDKDQFIQQIDLFKIWHYDNQARSTSLKLLEFNMRMDRIEECEVPFGVDVPIDRIDEVLAYNSHDVDATVDFYNITRGMQSDGTFKASEDKIAFREELTEKYGKNFLNANDTKIGKDFFIMQLEEDRKGSCFYYDGNKRKIRQTPRETIPFSQLILPCVEFKSPEFKEFFEDFRKIEVKETKGSLKGVHCTYKGFQFDFGTGGIHGSVKKELVEKADDEIIMDIDVASYYPNLAISNGFCPEHLGELFCRIYADLYQQRKQYSKKEYPSINLMLKLALNGVYGDSNSKYSPFYDPWLTMSITLNGQLLLCMLAEELMEKVTLFQINTDGMTFRCKAVDEPWVRDVMARWEALTKLELEDVKYTKMLIRDVNNYMAMYENGGIKEKGAYETKREWHKNHSMLVVPKAVKEHFVNGTDVAEFITSHDDPLDFCLRTKLKRSHKLLHGGKEQQRVTRYYVATEGDSLIKQMPPAGPEGAYKRRSKLTNEFYEAVLAEVGDEWDARIHTGNKSKYETRETILHDKKPVVICNDISTERFDKIDYDWYITQAEKLMKGLETEEEEG